MSQLQNYIQKKIAQLQFKSLTPIQKEVFASFEKAGNLVGIAPTGTGKTHAYLLPLLSQIDFNKNVLQAIILVPTNDLVFQVLEMLKQVEKSPFTKIFYGGMNKQKTLEQLTNKQPALIISTPDKILQYAFKLKKINLKYVSYLVLDEADMMFDQAFLTTLDPLVNHLKAKILLFSATITTQMKPFINRYFGKANFIDVCNQSSSKCVFFMLETKTSRLQTLISLTKVLNPYLALIFINDKKEQELVFHALNDHKLKILNYNSNLNTKQRKQELKAIHKLKYQYVIASDLASRGIDFDASCVIHYNLPTQLEFFFHRSGRTARMGKKGEVIVLYDPQDNKQKEKINKLINMGVVFHSIALGKDSLLRDNQQKTISQINFKDRPTTQKKYNNKQIKNSSLLQTKNCKTTKPKVTPNYKQKQLKNNLFYPKKRLQSVTFSVKKQTKSSHKLLPKKIQLTRPKKNNKKSH
ncbi:DEAD/DEAH box helicase [Candidatus Phytoplasma solani]|uniref:Superfamily II DNA/RNA helicase n=1 Tax=Candidatus Phytoplasma solani TaxID=69896 RepID=A0A421NV10_9MOLU|nr:DEAD/DEAH box helicase [Candidatus Phytoplasma solani]RMI87858.1 superfamily II DNA/RNA helicase [Candidatus Phytoplasma solani]CCP88345.1 DEAD/DEAH box helicase family protein, SrmB-like [Candidatus Phytoplasma solani]CCP88714.1 DNA and RNA helicae family protein [Candidatus Phytoplasma solani]